MTFKLTVKNCLRFPFAGNRTWFDIETCRTMLAEENRPNGWPTDLKRRLKPFMICVAEAVGTDVIFELFVTCFEKDLIEWFVRKAAGKEMAYLSRDRFDKLVLEGKWTSKYRKRLTVGGDWPTVTDVEFYEMGRQIKKLDYEKRGVEIGGAAILKVAERSGWDPIEMELVARHCLRDVAELVGADVLAGAKKGVFDSVIKNKIDWEVSK
jgi:hypothetical protein